MKDERRQVDDRFLDALLEASLARAGDAEPRPGLKGRVLARVRAERAVRPQFAWKWQIVAGLAALAVVLVAVRLAFRSRSTPHSYRSTTVVASQAPAPVVIYPPAAPLREPRVRRERQTLQRAKYEPRSKAFPTPTPLSEEETLLLHARDAPPVLMAWSGNSDAVSDLAIKELDIPPLEKEAPPDSETEQK